MTKRVRRSANTSKIAAPSVPPIEALYERRAGNTYHLSRSYYTDTPRQMITQMYPIRKTLLNFLDGGNAALVIGF